MKRVVGSPETCLRDWVKRRNEEESMVARFAYLRAWQRKMFDAGWAGVSWPKEYGGRGATLMEQVIFIEEMARAEAPPMANVLGLGLIGPTIIAFGNEAQKQRYLQKILSAEEIWCQGFSEPNAGSDLAALTTEAKLDGDAFIVNGQKVWNSYGWAADWCELVVRTNPDVPKHQGPDGAAGRHEIAGGRGSRAEADERGERVQRVVLSRCAGAGGERSRQGERRLARGDGNADA